MSSAMLNPGEEDLRARLLESSLAAKDMFLANYTSGIREDAMAAALRLRTKLESEFGLLLGKTGGDDDDDDEKTEESTVAPPPTPPPAQQSEEETEKMKMKGKRRHSELSSSPTTILSTAGAAEEEDDSESSALVVLPEQSQSLIPQSVRQRKKLKSEGPEGFEEKLARVPEQYRATTALILRKRELQAVPPKWHAPWKLMRVISGELGWVRSITVDPTNEMFYTGSNDGTIKVWDLASGDRLNTLTGHISAVRGLAVCRNLANLVSASEDKSVMVWDLQRNRITQKFHGHLSGVYCVGVHPVLDHLVASGGRDSSARIWDVRQPQPIVTLTGHTNTVCSVALQNTQPQLITGSHDTTIRCWDLRKLQGATDILTHHKKAVRALQIHPTENTFVSGAADNLKVWRCPRKAEEKVTFHRNISGHNSIVNALALNQDNVLVSGGDDGTLKFWDWTSGHCFQSLTSQVQPGSLESEAAIFAMAFDVTGSRLFTCEGDKTIKVWKEDPEATEETHPLDWKPHRRHRLY